MAIPRPTLDSAPSRLGLDTFLAGRWLEDACSEEHRRVARRRSPAWARAADPRAAADRLRRLIAHGCWIPRPPRVQRIPKPRGGTRELSVFDPIDQAVHRALAAYIGRVIDLRFHAGSWGFRPRRSVRRAVSSAAVHIRAGARFVVDFDVHDCFGTVSHQRLWERLGRLVSLEPDLESLIRRAVGLAVFAPFGLAQGSSLSPLLCNVYLHPVDCDVGAIHPGYLRYADDIACLCSDLPEAERAWQRIGAAVQAGGQRAAPAKSGVSALQPGWSYLGWILGGDGALRPPRHRTTSHRRARR